MYIYIDIFSEYSEKVTLKTSRTFTECLYKLLLQVENLYFIFI